MYFHLLALVALFCGKIHAAFYYPDVRTSLLEHILVDNWGAYASNFSSAITPCTRYVTQTGDAALNSGRTTAAQWMRVLFHDFMTANVSAGTGGVDASIGFETARHENSGSAFNDSFTFWRPFTNEYVPMADLVALGTVMSNNLCGGRQMSYRPGRVDATVADPTTGVPAPETDLDETLLFFDRAGFNREDAIGLTACGHTLGSVHHGGFPDVVDETAVTPNNTNGGVNFDSTRGVFDTLVLQEYVSWTGQQGGPLVTTANVSTRSDLRLYESDNNATIRNLLAQGEGFKDTCNVLLGRAMNTVPSSIKLKAPIEAMLVKPYNVTYDFGKDGSLKLSGRIRILTPAAEYPPTSIALRISNRDLKLLPEVETGTSVYGRGRDDLLSKYGTTTYFDFAVSGDFIRYANFFSVSGKDFPIQSDFFIVPSETTLSGTELSVTAAIRASQLCNDISIQVASPQAQQGTLAPEVVTKSATFGRDVVKDGYRFCYTTVSLDNAPLGLVSLKLLKYGKVLDAFLINGGVAGW